MSIRPKISIIIPTHNRAGVIARALRSVISQTFGDWECLVVDDASADDTESIVAGFDDRRIHFVRHQENRGGGAARNTGISLARGDFLAFLDSDDEWLPAKLDRQMEVFRVSELEPGIVLTGLTLKTAERSRTALPRLRGWVFDEILNGSAFALSCSSWLVRREVTDGVRFDEALRAGQDRDFLLRASKDWQIDWVHDPMTVWHGTGDDHLTLGNPTNVLHGQLQFLEKYSSELAQRPDARCRHERRTAIMFHTVGNVSGARLHMANAVRAVPTSPKGYFWWIAAALGPRALGLALEWSSRGERWP